ncbi:anhydro-N-acetylmuramic acid kinase [Gammaproteobacteria bacterium]
MQSIIATDLYVGLMSGTSLDGVDATLTAFDGERPYLLAAHYHPYPDTLREELLALCTPGEEDLERLGPMDVLLGRLFAAVVLELLEKAGVSPEKIRAIGSHGQTVRHRPAGLTPFTLQIGDPNIIAQMTGITTVADFRRRDMAVGGQGAPLVPAFHRVVFSTSQPRVILNIGGIANITWLPIAGEPVIGFDTGPGNTLMDAWTQRHLGQPHDEGGKWAATGLVMGELLEALLADQYFSRHPPKSTGREYFDLHWLDAILANFYRPWLVTDVQATLCELTAVTVERAVRTHCSMAQEILVCGGGVHNATLMARLIAHFAPCTVNSTAIAGIDPDWVEAMAFAWLARRTLHGLAGNLPAVTGARQEVVLGGIYPKL